MDTEPLAAARGLHRALLDAWNRQDAGGFAQLFTADGESIGFDGSEMVGPDAMRAALARIFADHPTPRYVARVRTVRELKPGVVVLRAVAGMVPRGGTRLLAATSSVQVLVAVDAGGWKIASFQNTPAAYHGRSERVDQLTAELSALVPELSP